MPRRFTLETGSELPPLEIHRLTRTTLALYCGASGDYHPLHVDVDWVRENTPLPDVIGHGMLTMAYLGRLLTDNFRPEEISHMTTRFVAPSHVGDSITCRGVVRSLKQTDGASTVELQLAAETMEGKTLATGTATIEIDHRADRTVVS